MSISLIIIGILIAVSLPAFTERSRTFASNIIVTRALQLIGCILILIGMIKCIIR